MLLRKLHKLAKAVVALAITMLMCSACASTVSDQAYLQSTLNREEFARAQFDNYLAAFHASADLPADYEYCPEISENRRQFFDPECFWGELHLMILPSFESYLLISARRTLNDGNDDSWLSVHEIGYGDDRREEVGDVTTVVTEIRKYISDLTTDEFLELHEDFVSAEMYSREVVEENDHNYVCFDGTAYFIGAHVESRYPEMGNADNVIRRGPCDPSFAQDIEIAASLMELAKSKIPMMADRINELAESIRTAEPIVPDTEETS